jgi:hypothetical protein
MYAPNLGQRGGKRGAYLAVGTILGLWVRRSGGTQKRIIKSSAIRRV